VVLVATVTGQLHNAVSCYAGAPPPFLPHPEAPAPRPAWPKRLQAAAVVLPSVAVLLLPSAAAAVELPTPAQFTVAAPPLPFSSRSQHHLLLVLRLSLLAPTLPAGVIRTIAFRHGSATMAAVDSSTVASFLQHTSHSPV
jgi:hypothetical protein